MELPVALPADRRAVHAESPTEELIAWSMERFAERRMIMSTSFGMEGCALIDMYAARERPLTVVYIDTMFFFEATYALRDRMVTRYPHINFVNCGTTLTPAQQAEMHGPELWKSNPALCCQIRKVEPMARALEGVDVWITALRRSQSATRANIQVVEWDWKFQLLKLNPLASWDRPRVWEYIQSKGVPYNELHERGYPTVGCTHCTSAVPGASAADYTRAGRWNGVSKTECGLHGDGI